MTTDFIGVYKNAFSKEYCEQAISYFNTMEAHGFTENRIQSENAQKTNKDDTALYGQMDPFINLLGSGPIHQEFNKVFWEIYETQYQPQFGVLKDCGFHNNYSFKMQKTLVGGGYHLWHFESDNRAICNRLLAWTVYLNDVEEGGETEFLYQHKRIKPETGTLIIWPASFTHTHRGNPPLSNSKYIITGWTEY